MQNPQHQISLKLSLEATQAQCLFAIKQARNTSHALASLIALQSFVAAIAHPTDRDSPAHRAIKDVFEGHSAELRAQMLVEQASALADAMRTKNCPAITQIHGDISRSGFWQAAQLALRMLDIAEIKSAQKWALAWYMDAQSRALAASGYPEALNFEKAGISPLEFVAMTDASNFLMNSELLSSANTEPKL